jgi:hypothetical protein
MRGVFVTRAVRKAVGPFLVVACLFAPAAASAWTVTVHVHGAGAVTETTDRALMNCTVSSAGKSEASVTDCVAGTPAGLYASFDVINLRASVPAPAFDRGWRFLKWVDSSAGGGQINCDPQETSGDHLDDDCQFQIFENLQTNLYFDDIAGPQDTSVSGGPSDPTNQTGATFNFNAASDPDSTYECKLDRPDALGAFIACGTPADKSESYSGLTTNGTYTFHVRGKDPSGNPDDTPARYSWTVDTINPSPSITGGPSNPTNATNASFTIGTNEGTLACKLDRPSAPGTFEACSAGTKTYPGPLGDGDHSFTLRATDAAGNVAFAIRGWTIDTEPPALTLTGGPAQGSFTNQTSASFTIGTTEGTLACTLDSNPEPCTPPTETLTSLEDGEHTFVISATDAAGNHSQASRFWTVDTEAPALTLTGGPAEGSLTEQASATFTIGTDEGTLTCTHDGNPEPCTPPTETLTGLAPGQHNFGISATDAAGNASSETRTWTVIQTQIPPGPAADTTAPLLSYFKAVAHRIKNLKALGFLASCNEGCTLRAVAKLGRKTLGSKTVQLQAGYPTQIKIRLSRTGLAALRAKLRTVRAVMVTIRFTLTDQAGNAAPDAKKVKVRR